MASYPKVITKFLQWCSKLILSGLLLWWLILCVNLVTWWCPVIEANTSLNVAINVLLEVIHIEKSVDFKADYPVCGWTSLRPLRVKTKVSQWRENSASRLKHRILPEFPAFELKTTHQLFFLWTALIHQLFLWPHLLFSLFFHSYCFGHTSLCVSSDILSMFLPQGLCTCILCRESLPPDSCMDYYFFCFDIFVQKSPSQ